MKTTFNATVVVRTNPSGTASVTELTQSSRYGVMVDSTYETKHYNTTGEAMRDARNDCEALEAQGYSVTMR